MMKKFLSIALLIAIMLGMMFLITGCSKKYGKIEIERSAGTFTDCELEHVIDNENILNFDYVETKSSIKNNELGGSYKEIYYFTGKREGKTNITFTIKDGNGDIFEQYTYEASVDKNLNVKILKK